MSFSKLDFVDSNTDTNGNFQDLRNVLGEIRKNRDIVSEHETIPKRETTPKRKTTPKRETTPKYATIPKREYEEGEFIPLYQPSSRSKYSAPYVYYPKYTESSDIEESKERSPDSGKYNSHSTSHTDNDDVEAIFRQLQADFAKSKSVPNSSGQECVSESKKTMQRSPSVSPAKSVRDISRAPRSSSHDRWTHDLYDTSEKRYSDDEFEDFSSKRLMHPLSRSSDFVDGKCRFLRNETFINAYVVDTDIKSSIICGVIVKYAKENNIKLLISDDPKIRLRWTECDRINAFANTMIVAYKIFNLFKEHFIIESRLDVAFEYIEKCKTWFETTCYANKIPFDITKIDSMEISDKPNIINIAHRVFEKITYALYNCIFKFEEKMKAIEEESSIKYSIVYLYNIINNEKRLKQAKQIVTDIEVKTSELCKDIKSIHDKVKSCNVSDRITQMKATIKSAIEELREYADLIVVN
jgi:hypothetical protein